MKEQQLQGHIMGIMTLIAKDQKQEALVRIQTLKEIIFQELDTTVIDSELVLYGKYLKIIEQLQSKLD